jgi:glutaryl-CoA dehydrogenase
MARLNPFDLYDVASLLTEEELMIKESVARFVDEWAMPLIAKHFDDATFPAELVPEIVDLGLLGSSLEGYGCAGVDRY